MPFADIILYGRENARVSKSIVDQCDLSNLSITDSAEYRIALAAINEFSQRHPLIGYNEVVVSSPPQFWYPLTLIDPDWDNQEFQVKEILTNLNNTSDTAMDEIFEDEWDFHITWDFQSAQDILRFVRNVPRTNFGVAYSRPHKIITPSTYPAAGIITTTIARADEETVGFLIAAKILDQAASKSAEFAAHGSLGSDGVDLSVVMQHYADRAKYFGDKYEERMKRRSPYRGPVWVSTPLDSPLGIRPIHPENVYG